MQEILKF